MTTADLRKRIEMALRARDPAVTVTTHAPNTRHGSVTRWRAYAEWSGGRSAGLATGATEHDALAALAVAVGLNADGSDPRVEIDQLDALLARQHAILTGVADALRGAPGPLASHSHHDLAERAAAAVAEAAKMRAIIEGRTIAPTDAEIAVHAARGGRWRTRYVVGEASLSRDAMGAACAEYVRDSVQHQHAYLWWALDSHGRPCAWPATEVSR